MMMLRLFADMRRRAAGWPLALVSAALPSVWWAFSSRGRVSATVAMALVATYVLGPIVMLGRLQTPLIPYLPVSRRDVWRATWLMSTVMPAALTTALMVPLTLAGWATWTTLALSAIMNLLYAGAGCGLIALGDMRPVSHWSWITLTLLLAGLLLPIIVRESLPLRWSDVSPFGEILFTAGLAFAIWGWSYTPSVSRRRGLRTAAASSTAPVGSLALSRFSGLPSLLADELASSLMLGALMVALFLGMTLLVDWWSGRWPSMRQLLTGQTLLIFDASALRESPGGFDVMGQFGWVGFYFAAGSARFPRLLRHLRVLPLGTVRLQALLLGWPAVVWSVVWVLLAGLHWMMVGPTMTGGLHLSFLFACVGLSALGISIGIHVMAWRRQFTPVLVFPLAIPFSRLILTTTLWPIVIGAIAIAAAVLLNAFALSRPSTYQRNDLLTRRGE